MFETLSLLRGELVVLDLGSAHSQGFFRKRPELARAITLIEVDALANDLGDKTQFHRRVHLKKAVAGRPEKRMFTQRRFPDCSSFLEPDPELIKAYGLQSYFERVGVTELECDTIESLLCEQGINQVDLIKTDLEGMDFEVLAGAPEITGRALCIQSELRFQPFYQGEPHFHEVVAFLSGLGFELVGLRPEAWKYATPCQAMTREGRVAWSDAVFFLRAEKIQELYGDQAWKCFLKQIVFAKVLGLSNYAEYLCQVHSACFPDSIRNEMQEFAQPEFAFARWLVARINDLPLGWMIIGAARRLFAYGWKTSCLFRDKHLGIQ